MSWIDVFTAYLYLLKMVAIGVAVVIFISSLDDLFIDIAYWIRRVWRAFTVYARHAPLNYKTLYDAEEKPLAIMVPAWQEHGVIGQMRNWPPPRWTTRTTTSSLALIPTTRKRMPTWSRCVHAFPTCTRWSARVPDRPARPIA